jgi:hypothetical protein
MNAHRLLTSVNPEHHEGHSIWPSGKGWVTCRDCGAEAVHHHRTIRVPGHDGTYQRCIECGSEWVESENQGVNRAD